MGSGGSKPKQIEVTPRPFNNLASLAAAAKSINKFRDLHQANVTKQAAKNDFSSVPKPQPASARKRDIFNVKALQAATARAKSVTDEHLVDFKTVVAHLKKDSTDSVEILWAVYYWLTNVNVFSPKFDAKPKYGDSPPAIFKLVASGKYDLGLVLKNICKILQIPCVLIDGVTKAEGFQPTQPMKQQSPKVKDRWNFVHINGSWHFIHADYGARSHPKAMSYFFLTDAHDFNNFCHPEDPAWQLLHKPYTWEDFCKHPTCRPEFYSMGLMLVQPRLSEVTTNNKLKIEITAPNEVIDKILLHHRLRGKQFQVYVPKEDTISNDSVPLSPYHSEEDIQEAVKQERKFPFGFRLPNGNINVPKEQPKNPDIVNEEDNIQANEPPSNEENKTENPVDSAKERPNKYIRKFELSRSAKTQVQHTDRRVFEPLKKLNKPKSPPPASTSEVDVDIVDFPKHLERYVYMFFGYSRFIFEVDLPVTGVYMLDILGDYFESVKNVTKMRSLCQFKIKREGPPFVRETVPLVPEVGWGPNPYMIKYGMKAMTHKDGRIYVEKDQLNIEFQLFGNLNFHEVKLFARLRHQEISVKELDERCRHVVLGDTVYVKLSLPKKGRYVLKIYMKKKGEQGFRNICNYLISYGKEEIRGPFTDIKDGKYSKRMLRQRLQKAILYGSEEELKDALFNFNIHSIPDEGENKKATKRLEFFQLRRELQEARKRRNASVIKMALDKAKSTEYAPELQNEILDAESALSSIESLRGFDHPVQKLDQQTVAELKTYTHPLPIVYDVMLAVCVLLHEPKEELENWERIQHVLMKGGHLNIQYRIKTLDIRNIPDNELQEARNLVNTYSEKDLRSVSNGAAAFYKWVKYILDKREQEGIKKNKRKLMMRNAVSTIAAVNRLQLASKDNA